MLQKLLLKDHFQVHTYFNIMILLLLTIVGLQLVLISKDECPSQGEEFAILKRGIGAKADVLAEEILQNISNKSISLQTGLRADRERQTNEFSKFSWKVTQVKDELASLIQVLRLARVIMPAGPSCDDGANDFGFGNN